MYCNKLDGLARLVNSTLVSILWARSGAYHSESTRVGSSLASKYLTRVEVTDSDKHSSSFQNKIGYFHKTSYNADPLACWVEQDRVLYYIRQERLAGDKHTSLLGPFVCYKDNEVSLSLGFMSTRESMAQCYKTLFVHNLRIVIEFDPGKFLKSRLMFAVAARSLPKSGVNETLLVYYKTS